MNDNINIYPYSSCPCIEDCNKNVPVENGNQTNLGIRGCHSNDYYDYCHRKKFKDVQEPSYKEGYTALNPQVYKASKDFYKIKRKHKCNENVYSSQDPRLYYAATADLIPLDIPPMDGSVKLKDIYNRDLCNYGKNYKDYSDIKAGQITYYTNESLKDAFYSPVFQISSNVKGYVYKDPMGGMRSQYYRKPLVEENPINNKHNFSSLSWINDSTRHREDIIGGTHKAGGLISKFNEQKYISRW